MNFHLNLQLHYDASAASAVSGGSSFDLTDWVVYAFLDSGGAKHARLDLGEARYSLLDLGEAKNTRSTWARPGTPDLSMRGQRGVGVPFVRWLCAGSRSDVLPPSLSPTAMSH